MMTTEITRFEIENDMDVVLAHRRAMQLARFSGVGLAEQTRFATAVSEICRNCLEYAQKGTLAFSMRKENDQYLLTAHVADKGRGIKNLDALLARDPQHFKGRGLGIVFAKRLTDKFRIETNTQGTQVWLGKLISSRIPINNLILKGWAQHIKNEPSVSPYEELKERNSQLLQLTEELRSEKGIVELQVNEISKLNEKLEKSNESMRQFTYAVSHDLKTPLTSLKMALSLVEEHDMPEELKSYFQIIHRSSNRLDKTILSLIELLDLQSATTGIIRKVSLKKTFLDVLDDFSDKINEMQGKIQYDFEEDGEVIYVEAYLKSIFRNLISNSIKYSSPERTLVTKVSSKRNNNKFLIEFSDNGQGIDLEKNGDKLFTPFSRFSTDTQGKGIGLYIIKNMVERNGGRIDVTSRLGEGVTFLFHMPEYALPE